MDNRRWCNVECGDLKSHRSFFVLFIFISIIPVIIFLFLPGYDSIFATNLIVISSVVPSVTGTQ